MMISPGLLKAQVHPYTLESCINYAWDNSTTLGRSNNSIKIQNANLEQSKSERGPNLYLNGKQTFSSSNSYQTSETSGSWNNNSNANLSLSLNSEIMLYNGAKLKNTIVQSKTNLAAVESDLETQKEIISLNILSEYITVLLSSQNVENYDAQLASTEKQLELADVRKEAGIISTSDFLNIKSQYASDKATLTNAKNSYRTNLVALMQLMNMPINDDFSIEEPNIEASLQTVTESDPTLIYTTALGLQPSIKSAELNLESVQMNVDIAKADALPQLSLGGSIGTGYSSSMSSVQFGEQFTNKVNPAIGLSLSVPIYQRKKVKTMVTIAKLQTQNEELAIMDLKNDLRKYIEQACIDAQTASSNYLALQEQFNAQNEAYQVSHEMFSQGLINSVDFLSSKNNLISAENKLTQAKYQVLLQNKIIDYYMGNSILF